MDQFHSSSRIEDCDKTKLFYKIINHLLSFPNKIFEFMRKIGLSESEISVILQNKGSNEDKYYKMMSRWIQLTGQFTIEGKKFFEAVFQEVIADDENFNADNFLGNVSNEILNNRKIAIILYSVIKLNCDEAVWLRDVVRIRLKVPDYQINSIESNYQGDCFEQKYKTLIYWMQQKKLQSAEAVKEELKKLKINFKESDILSSSIQVSNEEESEENEDDREQSEQMPGPTPETNAPLQVSDSEFDLR